MSSANMFRNIKFIREYLELSQTVFGEKVGATKTMIQSYESGKAYPKMIVLEKIAEMSGLSVQQISFDMISLEDMRNDEAAEKRINKVTEGEYLRRAIRGRGMTIEQAAAELGISRTNLHSYLNKGVLPELFKNKLNQVLGIAFNDSAINNPLFGAPSPAAPPNDISNLLLIREDDLRRLITECVNDALRQFIMKAVS